MNLKDEFQVKTEPPHRGAWLKSIYGLFCLVEDATTATNKYVGCYPGDPHNPTGLPVALSFDKDSGELLLQIPDPENPCEPIIVTMKHVAALVKAAKVP